MTEKEPSTGALEGDVWLRLLHETTRHLVRERLPEADAADLAGDLVIEARGKDKPQAWLHAVAPLRAADWHALRARSRESDAEVRRSRSPSMDADAGSDAPDEAVEYRQLSGAQREALRHWLELVTERLDELWSLYPSRRGDGPEQIAFWLRRRHRLVLDGHSSVDPCALPVPRYAIPDDFDALVAEMVRRCLDTGEGRWIESADHRPTARPGRPPNEALISAPTQWRLRRDAAMRRVTHFAAQLVTGAPSEILNYLEKDKAAAKRTDVKRIVVKLRAVSAGEPARRRGRPRKNNR